MKMNYLSLYGSYLSKSIKTKLEYKGPTIIAILGFLLGNACSILSIFLIISNIPSLENWSMWQLGFLYGYCMLSKSLDHMFTDELWTVCYWRVTDGSLDKMFLRPLPILFQIIAETFQPEAFGEIIVGVVMLVLCAFNMNFNFTFGTILLLVIGIIFGAVIITSIKIFAAGLAFRIKRTGPILQILYNFMEYCKYPLTIFPRIIQIVFFTVLPYGLFIYLPVNELFFSSNELAPYAISGMIIGMALLFITLSIIWFNSCVIKYESAGN